MHGERAYAKMTTDMMRTNRAALVQTIVGFSGGGSIKQQFKQKLSSAPVYMVPDGWLYQNLLTISRMYDLIQSSINPESQRVLKSEIKKFEQAVAEMHQGFRPYKMLATLIVPAVATYVPKFAFQQTVVNEAMIACALERYRLANGVFPENLAALSPQFLNKIPHDIINGEPLKYRRTDDGKFILYSVGWNEADDGGTVAISSTGRSHRPTEGDWVWQYSTNSVATQPVGAP
jgi:hypothetical protein